MKRWKRDPFKVKILLLVLAVLLPVCFAALSLALLPKTYENTFMAALPDKFERLNEIEEEKIVIIGGSSAAFGLNSELIEEETGCQVCNFGLYATLGTKLMLDLSESCINEGDIIVLMPELDPQTLSLYFNAEAAWQALEGDLSMLRYVGADDYAALAGALPDYLAERYNSLRTGTVLEPDGIYVRSSFNEYGDIDYPRGENTMTLGYDPSTVISLTEDILDPDFVDYVNRYIERAEAKGAEVYFGFCPMNASAMDENTTEDSIYAFYLRLGELIHCRILGNPEDSIMDEGYFYDTNYHLNDAGVTVHTVRLVNDLLRELGTGTACEIDLPEPPGSAEEVSGETGMSVTEPDPWVQYFLCEERSGVMAVVGVTEEGMALESLTIPETADGQPVLLLAADTFSGCGDLEELTIGSTLSLIEDGAFRNCPSLRTIYIEQENADSLEVSSNLFDGASDSLRLVFRSAEAYANFTSGYWWSAHSSRMVLETGE